MGRAFPTFCRKLRPFQKSRFEEHAEAAAKCRRSWQKLTKNPWGHEKNIPWFYGYMDWIISFSIWIGVSLTLHKPPKYKLQWDNITTHCLCSKNISYISCMYVCMHACMHACMHGCMYVCMYVCIYNNIYIYVYGGFLKSGYPQIIHFNKIFSYNPPFWGIPILRNLHTSRNITAGISHDS